MKKEAYFYWGNEVMSFMRYMTLYSFCKLNPDWHVFLIKNTHSHSRVLAGTVEKQDSTEYKGPDYSNLLSELPIGIIEFDTNLVSLPHEVVLNMSDVHIKDILNWKILSEVGGLVADMDIIFTKPLDKVIHEQTEIGLVCFDGNPKKDYIPVSFMYSSGENEFFRKTYNNAINNYRSDVYESCGTMCIDENNLDEIRANYPNCNIQKLEDSIVFPFIAYPWGVGIEMLYAGDHTDLMDPDAVGIHWYGGAPLSQEFNNKINHITVNNIDNTITKTIRGLMLCQSHNNRQKVHKL